MYNNAGLTREGIVTEIEYRLFSELLEERFGMKLKSDKMLTFHMKVSHRLAILGLETYREYYDLIASDPEGREAAVLMSHLSNHETCFFRNAEQFTLLSSLLQGMADSHQFRHDRSLRILSVASATGEEAYTLGAVAHSCGFCPPEWDVKIIGIDIDPTALDSAQEASYGLDSFGTEISDKTFISEYFIADGGRYVIKPFLREKVEFRPVNLVDNEALDGLGTMDIIFCRNVLGAMSGSGIQRAVMNLFRVCSDEGYLFIGASEGLIQHTNLFLPVQAGALTVYRKNVSRKSKHAGLLPKEVLQQEGR